MHGKKVRLKQHKFSLQSHSKLLIFRLNFKCEVYSLETETFTFLKPVDFGLSNLVKTCVAFDSRRL